MSSKIYFWSDQHLNHEKIYQLPFPSAKDKTKPMRSFSCAKEADEYMIEQYNSIVNKGDRVYFVGDIAMSKKGLALMSRMQKGHNYLVMGNHDNQAPITEYAKYFNKIYGLLYLKKLGCIVSHCPLHTNFEGNGRFKYNIHGHLHDHFIDDARYLNVSVEHTGYKPILFEELLKLWNTN